MGFDFANLLSQDFVKKYLQEEFPENTVNDLFNRKNEDICNLFMKSWRENKSLNNSLLFYYIDLFIIFLIHKIMTARTREDGNIICNCIKNLCSWCKKNCYLFTSNELNVLLIGLFYKKNGTDVIIQEIMPNSESEKVCILYLFNNSSCLQL